MVMDMTWYETGGYVVIGFVIGFILTVLFLSQPMYRIGHREGYKQGQIDALTGNIKYELVTMPDSSRVWMEIGK